MTSSEAKRYIESDNYSFLKTNKKLNKNIALLCLGGSHAYGTNIETSDVDIRGIAINSPDELIGLSDPYWVFENRDTDTVVYSFMKIIQLLIKCNPNTVEILGFPKEEYIYLSEIGEQIINNRSMFLSQRCVSAFGGYATAQLRRLENALARDRVTQPRKEEYIMRSIQGALDDFVFDKKCVPENAIKLYIDKSDSDDMDTEIMADINLSHYPLRAMKAINDQFGYVIGQYSSLGKRNTKKDDAHLDKHAMHLVRLYLMCFDLLEKGQIVTNRSKDRDFLMSIRNGRFRASDGTYVKDFFELIDEYEKRLDYAKKNTVLPEQPDMKRINEFVQEINYKVIKDGFESHS